ncbi:B-lymphocyte antigen CD20 isoform X1 [Equus przewalskii]|uniref:B-lymphocyte antigen CD20 isoform X1 n=1 Tax=Equus przewalskii TaxID=9798 RepID=A0ABM2F1J4_EQUPR|nr:B-lymphocyte antigen CD20 isoform X1 [Equus caballus]XP_008522284.1 PREDICTED: B-lymphocyte antigen CD20 isoform X2 [Equus przewalskii]
MTTPRNSMSGAFPAETRKGPIATHPIQKGMSRRMPSVVGPTQSFFMRESKALGAVQIMNGLFHIALGGLLMIHKNVYAPISVTLWYPLWGGIMYIISGSLLAAAEKSPRKSLVKGKMIMNSLSLFGAISGIIFLIMDIFNITISHFFKWEGLKDDKPSEPYVNIYNCESANPAERNTLSIQYCKSIRSVFLKLVAAGTVENEWKKLCSRPKANVVLLSAEEKKEQTIEIKEEVVELTEVSSQPKNEEDIEIIPVQEEEEEEEEEEKEEEEAAAAAETNFPEPPQEEESSPIENDSIP